MTVQYTFLPQYNAVSSFGTTYTIDMSTDPRFVNVHAVQIKDDYIHIEYSDGTPVKWDANVSDYQDIIDQVEALKNAPLIPPTLEDVRKTTRDAITIGFNLELSQGFVTNGIKMNAFLWDVQALSTVASITPFVEMDIVDYDNVVHPSIPAATVNSMISDLVLNYQAQFNKKQLLRADVNAATTIEDLQQITW